MRTRDRLSSLSATNTDKFGLDRETQDPPRYYFCFAKFRSFPISGAVSSHSIVQLITTRCLGTYVAVVSCLVVKAVRREELARASIRTPSRASRCRIW